MQPFGPGLLEKSLSGSRSAPCGPLPKVRQTLCRLAASCLLGVIHKGKTEDFPVLGFSRASVFGSPDAQASHHILIQITNRQSRHSQGPELSNAAMTA